MTENICSNCKHLSVIISQASDYKCSVKDEYKDTADFICNCDFFEEDILSLREKEKKVW